MCCLVCVWWFDLVIFDDSMNLISWSSSLGENKSNKKVIISKSIVILNILLVHGCMVLRRPQLKSEV